MLLIFATKRSANGHRKYLLIDTETRQYSREPRHWLTREDFAEVPTAALRRLQEQAETAHFEQVDYLG